MADPKSTPAAAPKLDIHKLGMRRLMQLDACTRCGECLNWCPVYDQDEREELIPRTKILQFLQIVKKQNSLLQKALKSGKWQGPFKKVLGRMLNVPEVTEEMLNAFAQNLYECSTCGQCQVVCPANINTVELWEDIRELMVEAGAGPLEPQKVLVKSVKSYDNPWQQPRQARAKWARRAKKDGLINDLPHDIKKTKAKVLLWFGCTAVYDVNVRQIAINTVNILEAFDIDYGCLGGDEKCCGSVLLRMGDAEFTRIAGDNIKQLNDLGFNTLISSCSGCFKTIKEDYPKVGDLNFEVLHVVEFLNRLMDEGQLTFKHALNRKITFHDPCHLGRAAGIYEDPRRILNAIPGLELVEMERIRQYSRCCGAGGGVKAGFPEIQAKMSLRRVQEAEATGAEELISACPFCYAGLQVGIKASESPLTMKDVTSLVAEAVIGGDVSAGAAATAKPEKAKKKRQTGTATKTAKPDKAARKAAREAKRQTRRNTDSPEQGSAAKPADQTPAGAAEVLESAAAPTTRKSTKPQDKAARKAAREAKRAARQQVKTAAPEPVGAAKTEVPSEPQATPPAGVDKKAARKAEREAKRAARKASKAKTEPAADVTVPEPAAPPPKPVEAAPEPVKAALSAKELQKAKKRAEREKERAARRAARKKKKG